MSKKGGKKKEPERGPYQDLGFINKYIIRYRTEEIESFKGVLEKLQEEYEALQPQKVLLTKELLKTVEDKTREMQQCDQDCSKEERELELLLEEKELINSKILEKAENSLQESRKRLEETLRTIEERKEQLANRLEFAEHGCQALKKRVNELTDQIEKANAKFKKDYDFINRLWEHFRLIYVKNEIENLNSIKMKYLDSGIDSLTYRESFVIKERFRLRMELENQIATIKEQKQELLQQAKTTETYKMILAKMRRRFYDLIPTPEWTSRMAYKKDQKEIDYITHDEDDLCEHEKPFRVPLSVETIWTNYTDPTTDLTQVRDQTSSMMVYVGDINKDERNTKPVWKFDKRRVIQAAHEDYTPLHKRTSHEMNRRVLNCLDDRT